MMDKTSIKLSLKQTSTKEHIINPYITHIIGQLNRSLFFIQITLPIQFIINVIAPLYHNPKHTEVCHFEHFHNQSGQQKYHYYTHIL